MTLRIVILLLICTSTLLPQSQTESSIDLWFAGPMRGIDLRGKNGEQWYGLFETADGFELHLGKITITDVNEEINQVVVSTDKPGKPMFLFRGVHSLKEGPVKTVYVGYHFVYPGQEFNFRYSHQLPYWLSAYGQKDGEYIRNYEVTISHNQIEHILFSLEKAHPEIMYPTILWIGDIDRDDKPDMYLQLSGRRWALLLSSYAQEGEFLREVATIQIMGD